MQTALLAAVLTIAGWYATYAYAKKREDRTRRIEIWLKYRQRQIEELYGPLLSLIEQIFSVWDELKLETSGGTPWPRDFYDDVKATLGRLMKEHRSGLENFASS